MLRRRLLWGLLASAARLPAQTRTRVRGVLKKLALLEAADGRRISLEGDTETAAVLRDPRLADAALELVGQWLAAARFRVEPIHERGLFVLRNGKPLVVTYWCEICSIRTYSPGKCMCCQEETKLDLRDPGTRDVDPASPNTAQ